MEELFGLLNFLEPERFACASTFLAEFGELKTEQQVEDLKTLLKPMMLRRLKEDVEKSLAPKEETIIEVMSTDRSVMKDNLLTHTMCHLGGIDKSSEEVLPGDNGTKFHFSLQRHYRFQHAKSNERNDGTSKVLQPSFSNQRS